MTLFAPRIAPGISTAMARMAARFHFIVILLVIAALFLPPKAEHGALGLVAVACLTAGMIALLDLFPWDAYKPRVFTVAHLLSSSLLLSALVYFTGGFMSSFHVLFFPLILFSFSRSLAEMFSMTAVITVFYLLPFLYDRPERFHVDTAVVTVLLFFLGGYLLQGVSKIMQKTDHAREELQQYCTTLAALTADVLRDAAAGALLDSFADRLQEYLPSTYCLALFPDDEQSLTVRFACPLRPLAWDPLFGPGCRRDALPEVGRVFKTGQPLIFRLDSDPIDDAVKPLLSRPTQSILVVPVRTEGSDSGIVIFGEERSREREPFTQGKIDRAVAIANQVASFVQLSRCHEQLAQARRELQISQELTIKAERLAVLGEVTRAVEHEINNPLSVIVNWSEIYRSDESIDGEIRKKFQIMYDMAMRIMEVIRKLSVIKDAKSVEFMKGMRMTDIE